MNIIIAGVGKLGEALTEALAREGHDITVIDTDNTVVQETVNRYDVIGITGNGADHIIQQEAGAAGSDLFIAVTDSDELNLICCIIAKNDGARHTIARVRKPEYVRQSSFLRSRLGLNMLVNPEFDAAHEISRILQFPSAAKIEKLARGRADMVEISLGEKNPLCGMALKQIGSRFEEQFLVCAVNRGGHVVIPRGDFVLQQGDRISVVGSHDNIASLFRRLGILKKKIRSVMIIGGGRIGYYLARILLNGKGMRVDIIDDNPEICDDLARKLPHCKVFCGDGTDEEVLLEQGMEEVDACIALTGIDEENIIISMIADRHNVDKIILKVNRTSLHSLTSSIHGGESAVAPRFITAGNVVRYVRAVSDSDGGSTIETLYPLAGGQVEATEFTVTGSFPACNIRLRNLRLRKNVLIACVLRNDRLLYANGDTELRPDDRVVVVAPAASVYELSDILG